MVDTTLQHIDIPLPRTTHALYRGMVGDMTTHTQPVSVRWTEHDRRFVDQQAAVLGISFSEFVRWCALYAALEVNKLQTLEEFKIKAASRTNKPKVDISEYK